MAVSPAAIIDEKGVVEPSVAGARRVEMNNALCATTTLNAWKSSIVLVHISRKSTTSPTKVDGNTPHPPSNKSSSRTRCRPFPETCKR